MRFSLSSRFCLFNGVCVLSQGDDFVEFGVTGNNQEVGEKLRKSARNFFRKNGVEDPSIGFTEVAPEEVRKRVAIGYGSEGEENAEKFDSEPGADGKSESVNAMLLDSILSAAGERGATDVHIEEGRVRFRICGILGDYCALSQERNGELVRRVKALSRLDLLETRRGQDGQFSFAGTRGRVSVRVSCVPCLSISGEGCESVVLRLLDPLRIPLELPSLGFGREQAALLEGLCELDFGLVLVCGATGSGKSTTAASLLKLISGKGRGSKKIITIEDPPEYVLEGMTQIRVDERSSMGFSDALRLVFRQDPDVIFVGEVRDEATAATCMRAALTGHLVLATMHTSGFGATLARLRGLGVSGDDVSSSLRAVVMQRLVPTDSGVRLDAEIRTFGDFGGKHEK